VFLRFKEREENVKVDILHVYTSMLKQIPRVAAMAGIVPGSADDLMETEAGHDNPHQMLLAQVPTLVRCVQRQMKEKGVRTRQGCLTLLTELVSVAPGCLDAHVPTLVPGILFSLK
jgi:cullin-associated NEDD8-dissociated protein 1